MTVNEAILGSLIQELIVEGIFHPFAIESRKYDLDFTEWLTRAKVALKETQEKNHKPSYQLVIEE